MTCTRLGMRENGSQAQGTPVFALCGSQQLHHADCVVRCAQELCVLWTSQLVCVGRL